MSTSVKFSAAQLAALLAMGSVEDGMLRVSVVALESQVKESATKERKAADERLEALRAVVAGKNANEKGEIVLSLKDLCVPVNGAPFTFPQANNPASWAGAGIGSRLAYELGYKAKHDSQFNPATGEQVTTITFRAPTPAEAQRLREQIADADQKQAAKRKRKGAEEPTPSDATDADGIVDETAAE